MHAIQTLFSKGQLLFAQRRFKQAYDTFEQCTQIMPTLSAAWENMAVCLANQGLGKSEIQRLLLQRAPQEIHESILQKIKSLIISEESTATNTPSTYLALLQQEKLQPAVEDFHTAWLGGSINEDQAIQFLRGLFIAHEHSAKKQGQLYLPNLLNAWKDHPAIKHCMEVASARTQNLIIRHQQAKSKPTPKEIELLETLGLVHYTYTNYENAVFIFKTLCTLSPDLAKIDEYRKHLSTCYSLNAQYKEALEMDEDNCTAWERFDSTNLKAFRAQVLKNQRTAERIQRTALSYWPRGFIYYQTKEVTLAKVHQVYICGHDPMVFDADFVYAGNRGIFRFAPPNMNTTHQKTEGIVVFATNPNNYYHLLIEFSAKLLAADQFLPMNIPVYIPTSNQNLVERMLQLLNINRPIQTFSVYDTLSFETLYVVDVNEPGHFSESPANVWDCYLTHGISIQTMAAKFLSGTLPKANNRPTLIYSKRSGGARSFVDPENLIESMLQNWADEQDLSFVIFEGKCGLEEQLRLFQSCKLLFGIHGAGFTNLLFTPSDCIMVELPIHGNCNPLFQELSTLMQRQHLVCDVSCEYQGTLTVTKDTIATIQKTLTQTVT